MSQIFVDMFEGNHNSYSGGSDCYGTCNCNCDGCYGCNCNCYGCYSCNDCYEDPGCYC